MSEPQEYLVGDQLPPDPPSEYVRRRADSLRQHASRDIAEASTRYAERLALAQQLDALANDLDTRDKAAALYAEQERQRNGAGSAGGTQSGQSEYKGGQGSTGKLSYEG